MTAGDALRAPAFAVLASSCWCLRPGDARWRRGRAPPPARSVQGRPSEEARGREGPQRLGSWGPRGRVWAGCGDAFIHGAGGTLGVHEAAGPESTLLRGELVPRSPQGRGHAAPWGPHRKPWVGEQSRGETVAGPLLWFPRERLAEGPRQALGRGPRGSALALGRFKGGPVVRCPPHALLVALPGRRRAQRARRKAWVVVPAGEAACRSGGVREKPRC